MSPHYNLDSHQILKLSVFLYALQLLYLSQLFQGFIYLNLFVIYFFISHFISWHQIIVLAASPCRSPRIQGRVLQCNVMLTEEGEQSRSAGGGGVTSCTILDSSGVAVTRQVTAWSSWQGPSMYPHRTKYLPTLSSQKIIWQQHRQLTHCNTDAPISNTIKRSVGSHCYSLCIWSSCINA